MAKPADETNGSGKCGSISQSPVPATSQQAKSSIKALRYVVSQSL